MSLKPLPRLKLYTFLLSMPVIDLAINQILYGARLWSEWRIWALSFPLVFVLGGLSWYSRITASGRIDKRFPELDQTWKRLRYKMLLSVLSMMTSVTVVLTLYSLLHIHGYHFRPADVWKGAILALSVNILFETLYDADHAIARYKAAEEEKEMLRQANFREELDALKNQVNPHFLFNCFNTLSSLIHEDKPRADRFLNELSKVYRYLLKNNEVGLSTVASELRFVDSYFQLLQTRYGEGIQLQVEPDARYTNWLLPSLSLQLLIENAVKHNIVSKTQPLLIRLYFRDSRLIVTNNLQRRMAKMPSSKIGLRNIQLKYALLQYPSFTLTETEGAFTVSLPLLPEQLGLALGSQKK
ncbi:sensor histidine kinase [Paraflavitalea sp. CAU 1676]|uniref:sensor histidine kinase n=1 Tax=Paraflavitalea sp. CAU 1676 TaxID=3032598 RepID=UPI0023D9A29D|nr:sensor histidine kinase [Paraflavitalea sp. CAU 1676]MDF2188407.1 histidine kinase [Paraflavitalea sp. CAU 1676]